MKSFAIALQVEFIKLRRTLAFWMMFIAPLGIVALTVLFDLRLGADVSGANTDAWSTLLRDTIGFWVVLMLPLYIALESALLAQLEHSQKMWKHLLALPTWRGAFYLAKLSMNILLVGFATLILFGGIVLAGWLLQIFNLRPDFHWGVPNPSWSVAATTALFVFLLSWGMTALQTYVSMRWASFTVALGIGILGSISAFVFVRSVALAQFVPWLLPFNALEPYIKQSATLGVPLLVSLLCTILFTAFGMWELNTRDVA